ncbi:uncharacterized protein LOC126621648 [Malus sylvestris]|uniref:uncharacterized protein LOC126621648 n=1 Tax=Malus sylvestris TaxID=3752 RepID=UPI0021AC0B0E|nr:uncharacterized protein LOC126621648 [Malus sylvestris]
MRISKPKRIKSQSQALVMPSPTPSNSHLIVQSVQVLWQIQTRISSLAGLLHNLQIGSSSFLVGEQMREQMKAQGEELKAYAGHVRDLVRAIQMSGLQISLPVPNLGTPSTSEPLHLEDYL